MFHFMKFCALSRKKTAQYPEVYDTEFNIKVEEMLVNLRFLTVCKKTPFDLILGDCWFPLQILYLYFLTG